MWCQNSILSLLFYGEFNKCDDILILKINTIRYTKRIHSMCATQNILIH